MIKLLKMQKYNGGNSNILDSTQNFNTLSLLQANKRKEPFGKLGINLSESALNYKQCLTHITNCRWT